MKPGGRWSIRKFKQQSSCHWLIKISYKLNVLCGAWRYDGAYALHRDKTSCSQKTKTCFAALLLGRLTLQQVLLSRFLFFFFVADFLACHIRKKHRWNTFCLKDGSVPSSLPVPACKVPGNQKVAHLSRMKSFFNVSVYTCAPPAMSAREKDL